MDFPIFDKRTIDYPERHWETKRPYGDSVAGVSRSNELYI